ncbi:MAG TPA: GrpB family protein [Firmicutes bacterium]|nr:GrpB family protein [Bacillota bacterium]
MKVVVSEYDPKWPMLFAMEADWLQEVFGDELLQIHHIGSTSVPGLKAKPIIDIMPVVRNILRVDDLIQGMDALGYQSMGEFGIPGRRYFRKGKEERTHHVHVFQADSKDVQRHLAFRDFMRAHPDEAARYGELKATLAKQFPDSIESYMDGKDDYIKRVEKQALEWYRQGANGKTWNV